MARCLSTSRPLGEKVDRLIFWGYMAEVTVDVVEGANKDHVRRKNGGLECLGRGVI